MDREIKFRGKRVDNGDWVYGFLTMTKWQNISPFEHKGTWHEPEWGVREEYKHIVKCQEINRSRYWFAAIQQSKNFDSIVEVDPETVGQFTGLKDKNGKEIYEGDILRDTSGKTYRVVWGHDLLWLAQTRETHSNCYCPKGVGKRSEVIGNIYDNPELLEVSNA